jgi:hypothetical protein
MRQEVSAGVKAGLVSGLPLAVSFVAFAVFILDQALFKRFHSYTILPNGMMLPIVLAIIAVVYLAAACLVGATAGFIFAVVVNKFPVRSTYVKSIVSSVIVWLLTFMFLDDPFSGSLSPLALAFALVVLAFFIGDSAIFAYLFNRWTSRSFN